MLTAKKSYDTANRPGNSHKTALESWAAVVQQYSFRRLSFDNDRFPAISGLTHGFETHLGAYVAGLWTRDLPIWLLWKVNSGYRTESYIAPSWSWASITCGSDIEFLLLDGVSPDDLKNSPGVYLHVQQVVCKPRGPDLAGAIVSGYLKVRGRIASVHLVSDSNPRVLRNGLELPVYIDISSWFGKSHQEINTSLASPTICLLVCASKNRAWFLVLTVGDKEGQYERCGIGMAGESMDRAHEVKQEVLDASTLEAHFNTVMTDWFPDGSEQDITII